MMALVGPLPSEFSSRIMFLDVGLVRCCGSMRDGLDAEDSMVDTKLWEDNRGGIDKARSQQEQVLSL